MDTPSFWSPEAYTLTGPNPSIAEAIYQRVCRTDFMQPGFCLVDFGCDLESPLFRSLMVDVKKALAVLHQARTGHTLIFQSAARFDQQTTTKAHLDGGPDESLLMLGYEPSEIECEIQISDYAKAAYDLGITPKDYMVRLNPMFGKGSELQQFYTTELTEFEPTNYQLLFVNNSSASYGAGWQGTLHAATILNPDDGKRRIINSTMLASVPLGTPEVVDETALREFITTTKVRRQGYDKGHLEDDA